MSSVWHFVLWGAVGVFFAIFIIACAVYKQGEIKLKLPPHSGDTQGLSGIWHLRLSACHVCNSYGKNDIQHVDVLMFASSYVW